jgi:hypothetical protein
MFFENKKDKIVWFGPIFLLDFFTNMCGHFKMSAYLIESVVSKTRNVNSVDTLLGTEKHSG